MLTGTIKEYDEPFRIANLSDISAISDGITTPYTVTKVKFGVDDIESLKKKRASCNDDELLKLFNEIIEHLEVGKNYCTLEIVDRR